DFGRSPALANRRRAIPVASSPQSSGGWQSLLWLCWRQGRVAALILCVLGVLIGLALPNFGLGGWPAVTLLVGVVCGTLAFGPEQAGGSFRFLGDHRLPAWRVWLVKTGFWLGTAGGVCVLLLLACMFSLAASHGNGRAPRPPNVDEFGAELQVVGQFVGPLGVGTFLSLWLLYGFGVAQLCAMAFRKTPVAILVAVLLSNPGQT